MDNDNLNNENSENQIKDEELENQESNNDEMEEENNIVTLKDENGNDVNFEFLDLIEFNGENYVILLPVKDVEDEESDEVVILKEEGVAENSDEESYVSVDDEETLNKVFEIFKDKFKDEFNFED